MAVAVVLGCRAIARSLSNVATSVSDAGQNMTTALGGFWEATSAEAPAFVPLDEFISKQFLADVEGDLASHELVLEDEL